MRPRKEKESGKDRSRSQQGGVKQREEKSLCKIQNNLNKKTLTPRD
jgi:hypothetical protein